MNCKELEALLDPYVDGELDAAQKSLVDDHLEGCPDCRRKLEGLRALHEALQSPELRFKASDTLNQRLKGALHEAAAREARPKWPRWAAAAAVVIVAAGLAWRFVPHGGEDENDVMVDATVDQQELAVKAKHYVDLASTNPPQIESWFGGQVAFAPTVPDLKAGGYQLLGGRAEKVKGQPAAAIVYTHGRDYVTVFVCRAAKPGNTGVDTDNDDGYNVVYWTQGALSYWVVSRLDAAELKRFSDAFSKAI